MNYFTEKCYLRHGILYNIRIICGMQKFPKIITGTPRGWHSTKPAHHGVSVGFERAMEDMLGHHEDRHDPHKHSNEAGGSKGAADPDDVKVEEQTGFFFFYHT